MMVLSAADATDVHVTAPVIDRFEPVVLLGNSGTGKSHLLIGTCLAAAAIDHITFHAHIIETGTTSYRLAVPRNVGVTSWRDRTRSLRDIFHDATGQEEGQ